MSVPPDLPEISPLDEASPPGDQPGGLDVLQRQKERALERRRLIESARRRVASRAAPEAPDQAPAPRPGIAGTVQQMQQQDRERADVENPIQDVALDVGRGLIALPREIVGGVSDAAQETGQAIKDLSDSLVDTFPGLKSLPGVLYEPGKGLRFASGEEIRDAPGFVEGVADKLLPDIEPSGTVTGSAVRSMSKFIVGFAVAGKLKPIQALAQMGRAGAIAAPMVQGALSDFAVFDPQEERLSNLVQEVPALQSPITEFLKAQPGDTDTEGRLKNVVEGLGLGSLTDGFVRSLRALRSMRATKAAAGVTDDVTREVLTTAQKQRSRLIELIGDPEAKGLEIRPAGDVERGLTAAARKGAKGAADRGEVFVNWSRINAHEDVQSMIQELANAKAPQIGKARRGVRTWEATRLSAEQQDAWQVLSERKMGQPLNAEQSLAVRELWVRSGGRVKELAEKLASEGGELNEIAFQKQLAVHNAIQEQVVAARTETARALQSWSIRAGDAADFAGQMDQLRALTEEAQGIAPRRGAGRGTARDIARRISALADSGKELELDNFVEASRLAKTADAVRQTYYGAMLSSPHTHMRNLIGNTAAIPIQMAERRFAEIMGKALGRQNVADGEAAAQLFGAIHGFRRAFRFSAQGRQVFRDARRLRIKGDSEAARQLVAANQGEIGPFFSSLATGQAGFGAGKIEIPREGAYENLFGRFARFMDTATTVPMRALQASDEVFKSITFDMELNAQAVRRATAEVASGQLPQADYSRRIAELFQNPDEYARLASQQFAEVSTFTQPTGEFAKAARNLASRIPVLGRIALPFRSTPFNIASFVYRRTSLAPFVRQWRDDIFAGGARADIAWSQFVVGNAVLLTMADLALNGHLTGVGPGDSSETATLRRQGWQPSSVRVQTGEKDGEPVYRYFSYRGLEPIGSPLGLAADVVDILRYQDWDDEDFEWDEVGIAATMAIANQVTAQQYMSGVSGLINAMSDPQRYGESWWQRLATTPVPRVVAQTARALDPTARMATDMLDAIRAQTPGLSKDLPPRRDLWGRPIRYQSGIGTAYDLISPVYSDTSERAEPIDKELQRLEAYFGMPQKKLTFEGASISLRNRPKEYSRWVELSGNELKLDVFGSRFGAKDALNALVTGKVRESDVYSRLSDGPDGGKQDMIGSVLSTYREAATMQLLEEFPELDAELGRRRDRSQIQLQER